MEKSNKQKEQASAINTDYLKLRPEVKFIVDDAVVIITPGGYKRLNSKWIKQLHEKIYPILVKGCSKNRLLHQVPEEIKSAVNLYLQVLDKSGLFVKERKSLTDFENGIHLSNGKPADTVSDLPLELVLPEDCADIFEFEAVGGTSKHIFCKWRTLFRVLENLAENYNGKQISIVLLPENFKTDHLFTRIINWHLMTKTFMTGKAGNISFFHWDSRNLTCKLLFQKNSVKRLCFKDLLDNLTLVSPVKAVSQIPVSIASFNPDYFEIPEIILGLNYKAAAASLLIREIIRQTVFTKESPALNQNTDYSDKSVEQTHADFETDFFSSMSRTSIKTNILDNEAVKLFQTSSDDNEFDALTLPNQIPAIRYLQEVLRLRLAALPVKSSVFEKSFYRFSSESNSSVSVCEEKAFHDLLLQMVYAVYYSDAGLDEKKLLFYSNVQTFDSQKKLGQKIEKGQTVLRSNSSSFNLGLNKIFTFWGTFYWRKINR